MAVLDTSQTNNPITLWDNHADEIRLNIRDASIPSQGILRLQSADGSTTDVNIPYFQDGVIDGIELSESYSNGLEINFTIGSYQINAQRYSIGTPSSVILDANASGDDRIDLIYLYSGGVDVVKGTPSTTPAVPSTPASSIALGQVYVQNGAASGNDNININAYSNNIAGNITNVFDGTSNGQILIWNGSSWVASDKKAIADGTSNGQTLVWNGSNWINNNVIVSNAASYTGGSPNTLSSGASCAIGYNNNVSGNYSASIGENNDVTGSDSFTIGSDNTSSGNGAFTIGLNNNISLNSAFAIGYNNTSSGLASFAIGADNTSSGDYSFSIGLDNTSSGVHSFAIGDNCISKSYNEIVVGSYSTEYTPNSTISFNAADRQFVIGNGIAGNSSDALIVWKSGNTATYGGRVLQNETITSNATLDETHHIVYVDTTSGVVTVTLPSSAKSGQTYIIKDKGNANNNNITVDTQGSETIDGSGSITITTNYQSETITFDGTNYFTI